LPGPLFFTGGFSGTCLLPVSLGAEGFLPRGELAVPLSSSGTLSFVGGVSLCKAETRS
ncbi:unnamed protein product, partial [Brassica oleracea]